MSTANCKCVFINPVTEEIESIPDDFDEAIEKLLELIDLENQWEINKKKQAS